MVLRNTGKTGPCCDRRMDFVARNLKTLYRVGNISGYFRSMIREAENDTAGFRRPRGISCVQGVCRWESPCATPHLPPCGLWTLLWSRKATDAGQIQSRRYLLGSWPVLWPAVSWAIEGLLRLPLEWTLDAKGKHMWQSKKEDVRTEQERKTYWLEGCWVTYSPVWHFPIWANQLAKVKMSLCVPLQRNCDGIWAASYRNLLDFGKWWSEMPESLGHWFLVPWWELRAGKSYMH